MRGILTGRLGEIYNFEIKHFASEAFSVGASARYMFANYKDCCTRKNKNNDFENTGKNDQAAFLAN